MARFVALVVRYADVAAPLFAVVALVITLACDGAGTGETNPFRWR